MLLLTSAALVGAGAATATAAPPTFRYDLDLVGTYAAPDGAGAEIVAYDDESDLVLVTNGAEGRIDIFAVGSPTPTGSFDVTPFGTDVQSVAVHGGVAVAVVTGDTVLDPGSAVFFDPANPQDGGTAAEVGALPDMVTFTPDGARVLVANEGEPRCVDAQGNGVTDPRDAVNPEGSISVIEVDAGVPGTVATATFDSFDDDADALRAAGVRLTWPGATVAQDLEPEYIATDRTGRTAWVTLQENNAVAVVDVRRATVTAIAPLGLKDHSLPGNEIDPSDRDNVPNRQPNNDIKLAAWPVSGMYMPDGLDTWSRQGRTYLATANEGDAREYYDNLDNSEDDAELCYTDEARVKDLTLDAAVFTDAATLQQDSNLGRLTVTQVDSSTFVGGPPPVDGEDPNAVDGLEYRSLASYGARSVTIWTPHGEVVWDSGATLDETVWTQDPNGWVAGVEGFVRPPWATASYDSRS
ncbi:MAG: choice-of-anchor I family protein, partial [Acidimicrobiales bacterium]|nr:choice-of-anchor I family protein [Acidimicrobiales bacterium]